MLDEEAFLEYADMLEGIAASAEGIAAEIRMRVDAARVVKTSAVSYGAAALVADTESVRPKSTINIKEGADIEAYRRLIKNQFINGSGGPLELIYFNGRKVVINTLSEVDNELGVG